MSFSIILLILESNEIERYLLQLVSSFPKTGTTFAVFKLKKKIPVENDKFAISDNGLLTAVSNNFTNLM